jgi:hypothetical protein
MESKYTSNPWRSFFPPSSKTIREADLAYVFDILQRKPINLKELSTPECKKKIVSAIDYLTEIGDNDRKEALLQLIENLSEILDLTMNSKTAAAVVNSAATRNLAASAGLMDTKKIPIIVIIRDETLHNDLGGLEDDIKKYFIEQLKDKQLLIAPLFIQLDKNIKFLFPTRDNISLDPEITLKYLNPTYLNYGKNIEKPTPGEFKFSKCITDFRKYLTGIETYVTEHTAEVGLVCLFWQMNSNTAVASTKVDLLNILVPFLKASDILTPANKRSKGGKRRSYHRKHKRARKTRRTRTRKN